MLRPMTLSAHVPDVAIPLPPLPPGIDTPALVVFVDRVYENIDSLARSLAAKGLRNRPHAKTHKSVRIARMQLDAGASGISVGTIGEAEAFALAGIRDLFIAYPVWAAGPKEGRLRALHDVADLIVGVDSPAGARRLGAAVEGTRRRLRVMIEVDSGLHRTGAPSPGDAALVAVAASRAGLEVEGVFTHGGHGYRPGAAGAAARDEATALGEAARAITAAGFEVRTLSAGSTPTRLLAGGGPVNEVRAGTYVYGDRQQLLLEAIEPDSIAAVVAATVVSVAPGRAVIDAGAKALTKDLPAFVEGYGTIPAWPGAIIERLSDYHGVVALPGPGLHPAVGDIVAVVPNHICPVVDLVASFIAVQPDGRVEHWPVDARGRSG